MDLTKGCCCDGPGLAGKISPFRRAIALEYGDGPVTGVAQCGRCGCCSRFSRTDFADPLASYLLAPLPDNSLELLLGQYVKFRKPNWPIWVPPTAAAECDREVCDRLERDVLGRCGTPGLLIATKHLINGRVLAAVSYEAAPGHHLRDLGIR